MRLQTIDPEIILVKHLAKFFYEFFREILPEPLKY